MTPDPTLVTAALRLPLDARRRLAAQEGPGWWVDETGSVEAISETAKEGAFSVASSPDGLTMDGWLWWPADSASWLDAATPAPWTWIRHGGLYQIPGINDPAATLYSNPVECALRAWGVMP